MAEPAVFGGHGLHSRAQRLDSLLRRALLDLNGRDPEQRRPVLRMVVHFFLEFSQRRFYVGFYQVEAISVVHARLTWILRKQLTVAGRRHVVMLPRQSPGGLPRQIHYRASLRCYPRNVVRAGQRTESHGFLLRWRIVGILGKWLQLRES